MAPTSVPRGLTPIIGRESEIETLRSLVASTRLLTLTGAGGSGKTRLASELARLVASSFPGGTGWVELAPLADPGLLAAHVLDALGLEHGARPPLDTIVDALRPSRFLLVLDNCEHLVAGCAAFVERVLSECEGVTVVATSREALGVPGERAWLVTGLGVPLNEGDAVDRLALVPAVQLFVERAQAALSAFRITEANAGAVAQICRRLDGLPLAIELAAARTRTLPPEELATRLDDAFRVLGSGSRTAVPRHRTLREAIGWSYRLLDDGERTLLQRLSMFAGDFTLNAAESVGADADLDAADVLEILGSLVDKSLVVMREEGGTARFQLLETIRQFASQRLRDTGEFHRVCTRHAGTYMRLAEDAAPHLITRKRPEWVQRLQRELDNVRTALACTRDDDVPAHLRFLGNLGWFWYSSGHWSEGRRWLEGGIALEAPANSRHDRARVLFAAGVLASLQGDTSQAVQWVAESEALCREAGDESGVAYAQAYQGVAWGLIADSRAEVPTESALAWFRTSGDLYGLRLCLVVAATYWSMKGKPDLAREMGEEAVGVARAFGLDRELAIALQVLAGVYLIQGDVARANQLYRECVAALRRDPSLFWTARALHMLALVSFKGGDAERGAYLMGAAESVRERVGATLFGHDRANLEPQVEAARTRIGAERYENSRTAGKEAQLERLMEELSAPVDAGATRPEGQQRSTLASQPVLEVRALGSVSIVRDGVPLPASAWRYAKPRELLLFLMLHPEGRSRDQVGLVFWPDASAVQVKNNFHVMLHGVRKALGRADLITFERDRYRMNWEVGITFDARDFEEQARAGIRGVKAARSPDAMRNAVERLAQAAALYRGDLMATEEAGDWHLEHRDRLRRLFGEAVQGLGDQLMQQGEHREAAALFTRILETDDLNEPACRGLMLALARAGDRSEALRRYDRLASVLRAELSAEPDRDTKALFERLRRAEVV